MARGAVTLREGERLDDLEIGGLMLIQRPDAFCFGTDSVLLADFAAPRKRDVAVDLGCGTGAVATLMAAHQRALTVDAVELQPAIADMARRSAEMNALEARLRVHCMDIRGAWRTLGCEKYTLAVCNPPYRRPGAGAASPVEAKRAARQADELTCGELCEAAFQLLRSGGRLCVVFPAARAYEMMRAMEDHRLAPKRVRTVHGVEGRAPKIVLMDAVKDGGSGLEWMPPLALRHADGRPTDEWARIYGKGGA